MTATDLLSFSLNVTAASRRKVELDVGGKQQLLQHVIVMWAENKRVNQLYQRK